MAGDTHDLEHYTEPPDASGRAAALGQRRRRRLSELRGGARVARDAGAGTWAYYPSSRAVVDKIERTTPWWKRPAWWWTRSVNAWPFSAEWLSAVFDYNTAPFFQSFVEVASSPDRLIVRPLRRARSAALGRHGPLAGHRRRRPPGSSSGRWRGGRRISGSALGVTLVRGRAVRRDRPVDLGGSRRAEPAFRARRPRIRVADADRRALVPDHGAPSRWCPASRRGC